MHPHAEIKWPAFFLYLPFHIMECIDSIKRKDTECWPVVLGVVCFILFFSCLVVFLSFGWDLCVLLLGVLSGFWLYFPFSKKKKKREKRKKKHTGKFKVSYIPRAQGLKKGIRRSRTIT